jgi:hypothetical protein
MIRRRPFVITPKSTVSATVKKLLFLEMGKKKIVLRGPQLPHTRYKRKKKSKLMRKHQWMPFVSFFAG